MNYLALASHPWSVGLSAQIEPAIDTLARGIETSIQPVWILLAFRFAGLCAVAPFFCSRLLPQRLRIGFIVLLAAAVFAPAAWQGTVGGSLSKSPGFIDTGLLSGANGLAHLGVLLLGELAIGALLGWTSMLVLGAVEGAAQLVAQQSGLSAASVADPQGGSPEVGLAFLYRGLAIFVFLSVDLHHSLLRSISSSLEVAPLGAVGWTQLGEMTTRLIGGLGVDVFRAALALALPVVLAMGMVSLVQGVLGRMLPEAEIFTLGLPLRALVALVTIAATLPSCASFLGGLWESAVEVGHSGLLGL